jgi:hypothetical protein
MRPTRSESSLRLASPAPFSRLVLERAEVEPALGHRHQRLAVELGDVARRPIVDAVGQQQHLDPLLAEHFEMGLFRAALNESAVT